MNNAGLTLDMRPVIKSISCQHFVELLVPPTPSGLPCVAEAGSSGVSAVSEHDRKMLAALRVDVLHYVDAGLNNRGAYLTHAHLLSAAGRCRGAGAPRPLRLCLHGTPRQWEDRRRAWVADEKRRMASLAAGARLDVHERMYFAGERPSLAMHFRCLEAFDPALGAA